MILALLLGAALGAQASPPAEPGPLERFVICPGNRRCPLRPSAGRSEGGKPRVNTMIGAMPGLLIGHARPRDLNAGRPNMLLFAAGDAGLSVEARALLDAIVERMGAAGAVEMLLEGHADSRGSEAANRALAGRRAQAAADYLIGRGVPADRILAISWGEAGQAAAAEPRSVVVTLRRRPAPAAP
jgi:outer membrane protein OmpA-like peptidoglycan-associated protein